MTPLAAVLVDQTLPPSLVAPMAVLAAVLAALVALSWLATRPGGPPPLARRALAAAGALLVVWAGAALAVALRGHALASDLAEREAAFARLGSQAAPGLESLDRPVGACADALEGGSAASLVGYLSVPPRAGVPREQLPRPGYPRLLVPTDVGAVVITSLPSPPREADSVLAYFTRAASTAPWKWAALLAPPKNPLTLVRYLVVASLRSFDARTNRVEAAVRVLPAAGGAPVCEGSYTALVPPGVGALFPLASALEASAFSAVGRAGGTTFAAHVERFAPRAPALPPGP